MSEVSKMGLGSLLTHRVEIKMSPGLGSLMGGAGEGFA